MKGLTLTQPWASLMACGAKRVETRSWKPPDWLIGQAVAIHAGKGLGLAGGVSGLSELCLTLPFDAALARGGYAVPGVFPAEVHVGRVRDHCGLILAEAVLLAARPAADMRDQLVRQANFTEIAFGDYTPGRWAWMFDEPYRLPEPIPCDGARRLWDVPEDIADRLAETALAEGRDHL